MVRSCPSSIVRVEANTCRAGQQGTHHHTMHQRAIEGLQQENMSNSAIGNYSRTPELRVSHKLAERKRRSEMKDLFEDLNKAVPSNGGTKASKWEILTKGKPLLAACLLPVSC